MYLINFSVRSGDQGNVAAFAGGTGNRALQLQIAAAAGSGFEYGKMMIR